MIRDRVTPGNQAAHALGLAIYCYANDNNGHYPDGKSSTEVFQKPIDGGYITDAGDYFVELSGKTKPVAGQPLKPENVCWDVTGGVTTSDPESIPLIFLTGYKIAYRPNGPAVPLVKPMRRYFVWPRSWSRWWGGYPDERTLIEDGLPVYYKNNSARFLLMQQSNDGADKVLNFVPADFDGMGKTYRQLTPDGVLAP